MGGGNLALCALPKRGLGLSPRGRGKRAQSIAPQFIDWSIPAWAGETTALPSLRPKRAVYPRVGGGNSKRGYYPAKYRGLSPRGRGKLADIGYLLEHLRSIPAWAGETRIRLVAA